MKSESTQQLRIAIRRRIDKAIHQYGMIAPHDRIVIGISGGKDSLTLTQLLAEIRRHGPVPFALEAVHIHTELSSPHALEQVQTLCERWDVPFSAHRIDIHARVQEGRRFNCYWCATQRRTELLRIAADRGAQAIALGHHMDDILETFFMNMTHKAELSTMLPLLQYDKYPLRIIRPLAWTEEQLIQSYAAGQGWDAFVCQCGFDTTSKRRAAREMVEQVVQLGGPGSRRRMYEALHNVKALLPPSRRD